MWVATPDAREIDYDHANTGRTKPTFAAVRVVDLLRAVTDLYARAPRLQHKMRFLVGIQVEVLDM